MEFQGIGGVEVHVLTIAKVLSKKFDLFLAAGSGELSSEFKKYCKKTSVLDFYDNNLENVLFNGESIAILIKEEEIDIIHVHQHINFHPVFLTHNMADIPYVITLHLFLLLRENWRQHWGEDFIFFLEVFFRYASIIFTISKKHKKFWESEIPELKNKLIVNANYINTSEYEFTLGSTFLIVIQLEEDKEIILEDVDKFISKLRSMGIPATLAVASGGSLEKELKLSYKNIPHIIFLGKCKNINKIIKNYDIIIGSDKFAIEAMINGKIIILSGFFENKGLITTENFIKFTNSNFTSKDFDGVDLDDLALSLVSLEKEKNANEIFKLFVNRFGKDELIEDLGFSYESSYKKKQYYTGRLGRFILKERII